MAKYCNFGKDVKKKLVDIDQTQDWLIEKVSADTGRYFDSGYMYRILTGQLQTPGIIKSICKILDIASPLNAGGKKGA